MGEQLMIWPMIILALATLYLYVPMSKSRLKAVREKKVDPAVFKLNTQEPEESRVFINAIANQYETPTLFYAVCLAAYVTHNASIVMIVLAWAYVLLKLAHVWVQITSNNLRQRRPIFMGAFFTLILMWVVLVIQLLMG